MSGWEQCTCVITVCNSPVLLFHGSSLDLGTQICRRAMARDKQQMLLAATEPWRMEGTVQWGVCAHTHTYLVATLVNIACCGIVHTQHGNQSIRHPIGLWGVTHTECNTLATNTHTHTHSPRQCNSHELWCSGQLFQYLRQTWIY